VGGFAAGSAGGAGAVSADPWEVLGAAALAEALQAEGVYVLDAERTIVAWNAAAEKITGWTAEDVIGRACSDELLCHVDADGYELCKGGCPVAHALADGRPRRASVQLHRRDGRLVPVDVAVVPLRLADGRQIAIETFVDSDHAHAPRLRSQALLDALTGLPNRRYYARTVDEMMAERQRMPGPEPAAWGIVLVDLDGLKAINDTWGHQAGDDAIQGIATALVAIVRRSDFLARWAGDEFVVLMRKCASIDDVERLVARIRQRAMDVALPDGTCATVSIGGALADALGTEPVDVVFLRADAALRRAKQGGRNMGVVSR
jgi:diguanylate cyclase (GGDEF)-like protein/PAS domain S-box-containing protein